MVIDQYCIGYIHDNHERGGSRTVSQAKKKMKIEYDRVRAQECVFMIGLILWPDLMTDSFSELSS